jgi:hypothetical protein
VTLLDVRPGSVVDLASGERVEVLVANVCRVRIRPMRSTEHVFVDGHGRERRMRVRAAARDVAPSVPVARVVEEPAP